MKVIIQDIDSELYLANGQWVDGAKQAEDYRVTARAYELGKSTTADAFNVIFYFPQADLSLIVASGCGAGEFAVA